MNLVDVQRRVRALERADKLEKMLADGEAELPWADFAWMLQFPAWIGLVISISRLASTAMETKETPPDAELLAAFGLALVALLLKFCHPLLRSRAERRRRRLRKKGLVVPAALVQANDAWFDGDEWLPGTVLLSFDPAVLQHPERLREAARGLFELKHQDRAALPQDQRAVAWNLYHELGPVRTRPVPKELCGGLERCVVADVVLPPRPLQAGPLMLTLATPGETHPDGVAVLPAEIEAK